MKGHHGGLISQEVGGEHEGIGAGREVGTVVGTGRAGQGVEGKPRRRGEPKAGRGTGTCENFRLWNHGASACAGCTGSPQQWGLGVYVWGAGRGEVGGVAVSVAQPSDLVMLSPGHSGLWPVQFPGFWPL